MCSNIATPWEHGQYLCELINIVFTTKLLYMVRCRFGGWLLGGGLTLSAYHLAIGYFDRLYIWINTYIYVEF